MAALVRAETKDDTPEVGRRHKKDNDMSGWSHFARALGAFYLEIGVAKGVRGRVFDMSVRQVLCCAVLAMLC